MQPPRRQPTRLLSPWNSPGKNTGVDCHALLQGTFPGMEPTSLIPPVLAGRFFTTSAIWEAVMCILLQKKKKKAWLQGDEFRASVSAANEQALLKADDSGDCSCHIWDVLRRLKQQTVYD